MKTTTKIDIAAGSAAVLMVVVVVCLACILTKNLDQALTQVQHQGLHSVVDEIWNGTNAVTQKH